MKIFKSHDSYITSSLGTSLEQSQILRQLLQNMQIDEEEYIIKGLRNLNKNNKEFDEDQIFNIRCQGDNNYKILDRILSRILKIATDNILQIERFENKNIYLKILQLAIKNELGILQNQPEVISKKYYYDDFSIDRLNNELNIFDLKIHHIPELLKFLKISDKSLIKFEKERNSKEIIENNSMYQEQIQQLKLKYEKLKLEHDDLITYLFQHEQSFQIDKENHKLPEDKNREEYKFTPILDSDTILKKYKKENPFFQQKLPSSFYFQQEIPFNPQEPKQLDYNYEQVQANKDEITSISTIQSQFQYTHFKKTFKDDQNLNYILQLQKELNILTIQYRMLENENSQINTIQKYNKIQKMQLEEQEVVINQKKGKIRELKSKFKNLLQTFNELKSERSLLKEQESINNQIQQLPQEIQANSKFPQQLFKGIQFFNNLFLICILALIILIVWKRAIQYI